LNTTHHLYITKISQYLPPYRLSLSSFIMVSSTPEMSVRSLAMMFEKTMPVALVSSSSPASKLHKRVEEQQDHNNNHNQKWESRNENSDLHEEQNCRRDELEEREDSLPASDVTDRVGSIYQAVATYYTPSDGSNLKTSNSHVWSDNDNDEEDEEDEDDQSSVFVECQRTTKIVEEEEEVPKLMTDAHPEKEERSHYSFCSSLPFDEDAPFDEEIEDSETRRPVVSTSVSTRTAAASKRVEVKVMPYTTSTAVANRVKEEPKMMELESRATTEPLVLVQEEKRDPSTSAPPAKQEAQVAAASSVEEMEIRPSPAPMVVEEALEEDSFATPTPSLEMEEDNQDPMLLLQVARRSIANIRKTPSSNVDSTKSHQQQDETNQAVDDTLYDVYDAFLRRRKISSRRAVPRKLGFATAEILSEMPMRKQVPQLVLNDSPSQPTFDEFDELRGIVPGDSPLVKTNPLAADDVDQDEGKRIESYWKSKLLGQDDQDALSVGLEEEASMGDLNNESYPSLDERDELIPFRNIKVAGKLTVDSAMTNRTQATCIESSKTPRVSANKASPALDAKAHMELEIYNESPYPFDTIVTPTTFVSQSFSSLDDTCKLVTAAATIANQSAVDKKEDDVSILGCQIFKQAKEEGSEHRFRFYEPGSSMDESSTMNSVFYEPTAGPEPTEKHITDENSRDSNHTKGPDVIEKSREEAETIGNTGADAQDERQTISISISLPSVDPARIEKTEAFFRKLVESASATLESKSSSTSARMPDDPQATLDVVDLATNDSDSDSNTDTDNSLRMSTKDDGMPTSREGVDPDGSKGDSDLVRAVIHNRREGPVEHKKEVSTCSIEDVLNDSKTDTTFSSPEEVVENGCDVFDRVKDERGEESANMEDDKEVGSISEIVEKDVEDAMERVQILFDASGSDSSEEVDKTFSQDSSIMSESVTIGAVATVEEEDTNKAVDECASEEDQDNSIMSESATIVEEEETSDAVVGCLSEEDDQFKLQSTPRHANTSPSPFRPRNGDADSNSLLEDEAESSSKNSIHEASSKSSESLSKREEWEDEDSTFDMSLDPNGLKNETVPDYAIAEVVDLIKLFKSEHRRNQNICSPNNIPDDGLLARVKPRRSNAQPQNEIAHDSQSHQSDKCNTPPASETQDEEEDENSLFGSRVLRKYSPEDDDGVSIILDKYDSEEEIDTSPFSSYFDQFIPDVMDKYSSADSHEDTTERPPLSGQSRVEAIAARGRAAVPPVSPEELSTSSRPHDSSSMGRHQSWDGSYLINTNLTDRPSKDARAESGVRSNVPSELISKASHANTSVTSDTSGRTDTTTFVQRSVARYECVASVASDDTTSSKLTMKESCDGCSSTDASSSIASMDEEVAITYRAEVVDTIAQTMSDANSIIDTVSEGVRVLTKPAKDVIMMGDNDIDIICGQYSDECTGPTSSSVSDEDEDMDDADQYALPVKAGVEQTGSTDAMTAFFWGGSIFACYKCEPAECVYDDSDKTKDMLPRTREASEDSLIFTTN
jgi:hypothetical protein